MKPAGLVDVPNVGFVMKILLTGATGFLGSALTKSFIREGHEVIIEKPLGYPENRLGNE